MREVVINLSEVAFNVYWRSLCDREQKLLCIIESNDEESDEAIVANNDIIYLRTVKESLEKQGKEADFRVEAFETSEEIIDLSKM
jgi:hypothetical protein